MGVVGCSEKGDGSNLQDPPPLEEENKDNEEEDQEGVTIELFTTSGILNSYDYTSYYQSRLKGGISSNNFIATCTYTGTINAEHVGEASVVFGDQSYNVIVRTPLEDFMYPVVAEFGKSKDYIASKEIRERHKGTHRGLIYYGEHDYIRKVVYDFDDSGALSKIIIHFIGSSKYNTAATYLGHFYEQIGSINIDGVHTLVYIDAYNEENATLKVLCANTVPTGSDCTITFEPI